MPSSYLVYHPKRTTTDIVDIRVHHDDFGGNEDPYLWNRQFLHTYCHITQMKNEAGQINFWVSGDKFPYFTQLFCDCVFIVTEKVYWTNANEISRNDNLIDNDQTFEHHYNWVNHPHNHHQFKRRRRYTIKADPDKSFQPQDKDKNLIDIIPFLNSKGLSFEFLRSRMIAGVGSRPCKLEEKVSVELYKYLLDNAAIKLTGEQLAHKHPNILVGENSGCC